MDIWDTGCFQYNEDIVTQGFTINIDEHTEWVNCIMFVPKGSGKLRINLDSKYPNKAIKRCHYIGGSLL